MNVTMRIFAAILAISISIWPSLEAQVRTEGAGNSQEAPFATGKVYSFEKIADGVYYATSRRPSVMDTGSNHPIIVTDNGVMLVDDGSSAAAASALVEDLKVITKKPVRWVVNTHFHYDHTSGNSVFGPDVEIIAQESVRRALMGSYVLHREPYTGALSRAANRIESLKKQIAGEKDAGQRAMLEKRLPILQGDLERLKSAKPTPPNVTFSSDMTLYEGQREIRLLFLGGGHTQGDTVVFLPKERIVCTGDLMEATAKGPFVPYMGDAMFSNWITSLEALKKLDFDTVLPGHGAPFHEKSYITDVQAYLRDFMTQVATLRGQGLSAEQVAQKVDLTSHKAEFLNIQGPGADIRGVRRMYEWMDEQHAKP